MFLIVHFIVPAIRIDRISASGADMHGHRHRSHETSTGLGRRSRAERHTAPTETKSGATAAASMRNVQRLIADKWRAKRT